MPVEIPFPIAAFHQVGDWAMRTFFNIQNFPILSRFPTYQQQAWADQDDALETNNTIHAKHYVTFDLPRHGSGQEISDDSSYLKIIGVNSELADETAFGVKLSWQGYLEVQSIEECGPVCQLNISYGCTIHEDDFEEFQLTLVKMNNLFFNSTWSKASGLDVARCQKLLQEADLASLFLFNMQPTLLKFNVIAP